MPKLSGRTRSKRKTFPPEPPKTVAGTLNGEPFETLEDADPRIGARLEVYAAGSYLWIPFQHVESIEIPPPKRLRDTIWTPALVRTGPAFKMTELGEVLLPVLCPFSFRHADDNVRLGRLTVWEEAEDDGCAVRAEDVPDGRPGDPVPGSP